MVIPRHRDRQRGQHAASAEFGTVNALLGNVDHAAVDSKTGDLYYAYGNRDAATGNDRLAIRRIRNRVFR